MRRKFQPIKNPGQKGQLETASLHDSINFTLK